MRHLMTLLWVRRRLAVNGLAGVAGATGLAAGLALAALAALGALAVAAGLAFVLSVAVASGDSGAIRGAWMVSLYTVAFFALVVPVIIGAGHTGFDPALLLRFPCSRSELHLLALASEAVSRMHLAWYPALAATAVVGVLLPGPERLGSVTMLALFAASLVLWCNALLLTVRRVLRQRRLREIATVAGLAVLLPIALLPAAVDLGADDAAARIDEIFTIPPWLVTAASVLPPSIAAAGLSAWRSGNVGGAAWALVRLVLWLAAGWWASRAAFAGLLRTTPSALRRRRAGSALGSSLGGRLVRLLPPIVGPVAAKELRYLFQSGVGRINLVVTPLMVTVIAALTSRAPSADILGIEPPTVGFLGVMVYAAAPLGYLQVNAFAWERGGVAGYFTSPVALGRVLFGKNLGLWVFSALLAGESLAIWFVVCGRPGPAVLVAGPMFFAATLVAMSTLGNFTSIAFPVDRPLTSISSTASPVGALVMIGCLVAGAAVVGIAAIFAATTGWSVLLPVVSLTALAAALVVHRASLRPAAVALGDRREAIFRALRVG